MMAIRATAPVLLALGAVTGTLAALSTFVPMGDLPGLELFGQCIGLRRYDGACGGLSRGLYLFPGLIFGLAFAALLSREHRLAPSGALAFALASTIGNALAVVTATSVLDRVTALLGDAAVADLPVALSGALAGAVGGGLLGAVAARVLSFTGAARLAATGAVLGLSLPIFVEFSWGCFPFYILWQAGYAGMLGRALAPRPGALAAVAH